MNETLTLPNSTLTISVVDSHTGGEPTRVVLDGFPALRGSTLLERRADVAGRLRRLATAIVDEPRGNEPMVAALLTPAVDERCVTGVIFFDRNLVLGMCGHGMIGLIETLHRLGRIGPGEHLVETPAGTVPVVLAADGLVTFDNVASRLVEGHVEVDVPSLGRVTGAIAYGGNVFFLVATPTVDLDQPRAELLRIAADVLHSVHAAGFVDVDHVELYGPATSPAANSRNFVLCPSGTYDRSPCGTGHERQGGGAGGRRSARRGRDLGSGVDHRVDVLGPLSVGRPGHRVDRADGVRVGNRHGTSRVVLQTRRRAAGEVDRGRARRNDWVHDLVPEVPTTRAEVSAICRDFVAFELIGGSNNSPDRHEPRK